MGIEGNCNFKGCQKQLEDPLYDGTLYSTLRDIETKKLYTSQDMTFHDTSGSNSVAWRTDEDDGYARITYNATATAGLQYQLTNRSSDHLYISYYLRRHSNFTSKQFKALGQRFVSETIYTNYTIGASGGGYTGQSFSIYYGDEQLVASDNNVGFLMDGTQLGGSVPSRALPTIADSTVGGYSQDITGSVWTRYEHYFKRNSDGVADGEFGIAIDGVKVIRGTNVFNCADGAQPLDRIGLGEYSTVTTPFFEDYKQLNVGYDRPAWMDD